MNAQIPLVWITLLAAVAVQSAVEPRTVQAQVVEKSCSNCGKPVALSSQVGGNCPHCGAYWGHEESVAAPSSPSAPSYSGTGTGNYPRPYAVPSMPNYPLSPMNVLAMRQLMELQEKQAARERLLSVCRRQREETIARQQRTYDRLAGEVEEFRLHDDPQMRAARLLASAETCEQRGSLAAATAYYRLVVRSLPNTPQAAQASSSLERLGVR